MPTQEEIYRKVSATLVEALNVDEDEVTPGATLQGDLGAESIDFLDIVFRLEREFGIAIPRGELFSGQGFLLMGRSKRRSRTGASIRERPPKTINQKCFTKETP
jgi:acyl carrier protein